LVTRAAGSEGEPVGADVVGDSVVTVRGASGAFVMTVEAFFGAEVVSVNTGAAVGAIVGAFVGANDGN